MNKFCNDLETRLSYAPLHISDIDSKVSYLFNAIYSVLDKHAPVITKTKVLSSKLFTTPDIQLARRMKRKAERKFRKTGLESDKHIFKSAYKKLVKTVKCSQNAFYRSRFENAKEN